VRGEKIAPWDGPPTVRVKTTLTEVAGFATRPGFIEDKDLQFPDRWRRGGEWGHEVARGLLPRRITAESITKCNDGDRVAVAVRSRLPRNRSCAGLMGRCYSAAKNALKPTRGAFSGGGVPRRLIFLPADAAEGPNFPGCSNEPTNPPRPRVHQTR